MIIWILDSDVSFAYDLKKRIRACGSAYAKQDQTPISVFLKSSEFEKAFKEKMSDVDERPHLILLEPFVDQFDGLTFYYDKILKNKTDHPLVYFCSAMSYGLFEKNCHERLQELPPYIQKSQVEKKIKEILERVAQTILKQLPALPQQSKKTARILKLLKKKAQELQELYYEEKISTDHIENYQMVLNQLLPLCREAGYSDLVRHIEDFNGFIQSGKRIGLMRLKKEIKAIVGLLKKNQLIVTAV